MAERVVHYWKHLWRLINPEAIILDLKTHNVEKIFSNLVEKLTGGRNPNYYYIMHLFLSREKLASTVIGDGVALPEATATLPCGFDHPVIAVGISKKGIKHGYYTRYSGGRYLALDTKPIHIVAMTLVPHYQDQPATYLRIMAKLSKCLKDKKLRDSLIKSKTPNELIRAFRIYEERFNKNKIPLVRKILVCDRCGRKRELEKLYCCSIESKYSGKITNKMDKILEVVFCSDCIKRVIKKIKGIKWSYELERS